MAIRVLEETGLLPHLNPGVMSWTELSRLKPVAPLDGHDAGDHLAPAVRDEGPGPLRKSGQGPRRGLRTLTDAGRLSIPFTTGLLVGID